MSEAMNKTDNTTPLVVEKTDRRQRHSEEDRQSAYELFEQGKGYKYVSRVLNIPKYTVRDWKRLFVQGRFFPSRRAAQKARSRTRRVLEKEQTVVSPQEAVETAAPSHWEN